ncbi:MAG TPA: alpha/beta fold hydrolase [Thermoanaerobaculia bacterium]|nr:alpha/beta fold hydrolase [Thermoanaerobaculia bacterium]
MLRSVVFLVLSVAVPLSAEVRLLEIQSKALAANRTGDPAAQTLAVYLPPGYESSTSRYPVIYLLHGIGDTFETWTKHWKVPALLDRMIAKGTIAPLIVVMPNGRNRFGGGFYVNSPVAGGWQDYIAVEIVALVDGSFRTLAAPESRAVVGHSMGGFGAIRFGMDRSDVFGVVFAMSPCCLDAVEDIGAGNPGAWNTALQLKTFEDVDARMEERDFYAVALIGMMTSLFPDADGPLGTRMPFRRARGELVAVEPVYTEWRESFPIRDIEQRRDHLLRLRGLGIEYGFADQFSHIPAASAAFSRELTEHRIPHLLEAYGGDHREKVPERLERVVLPWVVARLAR